MSTLTPSQARVVEEHLESLESIRLSIGQVVRTFESMHSPTAQMIAKLLVVAKEAVGRIDWSNMEAAVLEDDSHTKDQ